MSNVASNEALGRKVAGMEENLRAIFEQFLTSCLDKQAPVTCEGSVDFDFKELKALLPGEVVVVTLAVMEGGSGKILFAMLKENAGVLADLLLMGDGQAEFSHDEHIEPLREFFREVMASLAAELGIQIGHPFAFEEAKVTVVDLTPVDFVSVGWTLARFNIALATPMTIYRMISRDFIESCFPDTERTSDLPEYSPEEEKGLEEINKEMGLVLDIELPISIELGRTSMLIRDIVKLTSGSIVELDKLSGEPVDLIVNNKRFARGEVVVVDENFAVRITELINPYERMKAGRN